MTTVTEQATRLMTATVRSILSSAKVWNQKEKSVTGNSICFHLLFFLSLLLQRPNKMDLVWLIEVGPENWRDQFWSKLQTQLITVTDLCNSNTDKCPNVFHSVKFQSAWYATNTMHVFLSHASLLPASFVRFWNIGLKWKEMVLYRHRKHHCTKVKECLVPHGIVLGEWALCSFYFSTESVSELE